MDFNEIALESIFQFGGAFKAYLGQGTSGKPRYYFILNRDPDCDVVVLLATSTTQFEEHKNCKGGDDVHIPLSPQEYPDFTDDCLICCDYIEVVDKTKLKETLKLRGFKCLNKLPDTILNKLIQGVIKTEKLVDKYKELILGPIDPIEDF